MRRKKNAIIECIVKIMIMSILALIISIILLAIFSWTDFKDLFLKLLGVALMCTCYSFFAFLFFLLIFADSQTSYTADLANVPEEFEHIYKVLYEKYIVKLEEIRKRIKLRNILGRVVLGSIILYVPASNFIKILFPQGVLISYLVAILFIGIELILYKYNKSDKLLYESTYKDYVIKDLINMLNYNVTYESKNLEKIEYYKNKYIDARFWIDIGDFKAEDFIEGEIDDSQIKISDVMVNNTYGKYKTVFEGIFAYVDYNKYLMPNVVISRKFLFGNDAGTKVNVNNELFEQYFNVYTQNESYAKRLLNDGIIDLFLKFRTKYNIDFDVSLLEGKIYIKIYSFSVFEPEIFDKTSGKQDLYTHYCFSKFILDLIKEVKIIVDRN